MTDPRKPEQDDVDDLLLSALYRQGAEELPPPELDQAIREQARKVARRRRWFALPKVALAMSVLLGVGVALRVFDVAPPEQAVIEYEMPSKQVTKVSPPAPAPRSESIDRAPAGVVPVPSDAAKLDSAVLGSAAAPSPDQDAGMPASEMAEPPAIQNSGQARRELLMRERAKRKSAQPVQPVCHADIPPLDAAAIEWLRRIRDLREAGEQERASCLQRFYRERFSEPDQIKPPSVRE